MKPTLRREFRIMINKRIVDKASNIIFGAEKEFIKQINNSKTTYPPDYMKHVSRIVRRCVTAIEREVYNEEEL